MGDPGIVMRAIQELLACGHTVRHLPLSVWQMTSCLPLPWLPLWCNWMINCPLMPNLLQGLDRT